MRAVRFSVAPILLVAVLVAAIVVGRRADTSAGPGTAVGTGSRHENVLEFTGQINQVGGEFEFYGYFTFIRGLTPDELFSNPAEASEATARFTFRGAAQLVSHSAHSNVFNIAAIGSLNVYRRGSPGASFDSPSSFVQGQRIASFQGRFQDVIAAFDPDPSAGDTGIADGVGDLTQTLAETFKVGKRNETLGAVGERYRFSWSGWGTIADPGPPISVVEVAGQAVNP